MKLPKRLKHNTVYIDNLTGNFYLLVREKSFMYSRKTWSLKSVASSMPEEFNRNFKQILAEHYTFLGDL